MKLEYMSVEMARDYLIQNGVTGAFIWDDRPKGWTVYIGDPVDVCGWRESTHRTKKDALRECERLNGQIERLLK